MLNLFKNKVFLLLLVTLTLLIVILLSGMREGGVDQAGNIINVALSPLQKAFSFTGKKVEGATSFFKDIKVYKDENQKLKDRVDQLEKENMELLAYREENKKLREALNIKDQFKDYDFIGANVIAKDPGNWFNVFSIDRGSRDGIGGNYPVITSKGLVGRVINTGPFSSRIVGIIDVDSVVSGIISKNRYVVVLKGDLSLRDQGLCRMDYIPSEADVTVGDTIETSGLGGIFPKGIVIGRVKEVRQINSELNRYAVIEPAVDFKRLEEVFVLKSKTNMTETGGTEK